MQGILSRVYLNKLDYPNAYKAATDVIENSKNLYQLYTLDEYPTVWGKEYTSESLFEFYFSLTEPSGGSGGEGAPMVYANEEKVDWNNLILSEDYLNLLNEDLGTILRHPGFQSFVLGIPRISIVRLLSAGAERRQTEKEYRRRMPHPPENFSCTTISFR